MKRKERKVLAGRHGLWEALDRPMAPQKGGRWGGGGEYDVLAYGLDVGTGNTEMHPDSSALCISCRNIA